VANYQVVLGNIGNVYLYRTEFPTAVSYYQRALAIAREIKDPVSIRKWTYNANLAYMRIRAAALSPLNPRPNALLGLSSTVHQVVSQAHRSHRDASQIQTNHRQMESVTFDRQLCQENFAEFWDGDHVPFNFYAV
jgi:hypothetical protein